MSDKLSELWGGPAVTTEATVAQSPPGDLQPASPGAADPGVGAYVPWGREHTETTDIEIRCANGEWEQVRDPYIVSVGGVRDETVTLKCASFVVIIEGRNLGELRKLIRARQVDFIEEFDRSRWPQPGVGAPVIERMQIVQPRLPQLVSNRSSPGR